jgi:hypothetical protein
MDVLYDFLEVIKGNNGTWAQSIFNGLILNIRFIIGLVIFIYFFKKFNKLKSFETLNDHPNAIVAIAHPDDKQIRNCIARNIQYINKLGIIHFWVGADKVVLKEQ